MRARFHDSWMWKRGSAFTFESNKIEGETFRVNYQTDLNKSKSQTY